ncbi:MAG: hypothetical protein ABI693_28185 [Bryobacteraceae bacterium]
MRTLKDAMNQLQAMARLEYAYGDEHRTEVEDILDRFREKNRHPLYGSDSSVARVIRDVSWAFRHLTADTRSSNSVRMQRQARALTAVGKLKGFISANGDDFACAGWAACEQRYDKAAAKSGRRGIKESGGEEHSRGAADILSVSERQRVSLG